MRHDRSFKGWNGRDHVCGHYKGSRRETIFNWFRPYFWNNRINYNDNRTFKW